MFTLGYPDREVEQGIMNNMLELYVPDSKDIASVVSSMRDSLCAGRPQEFISRLKAYLSGVPSKLRTRIAEYENYYHTILYCIASLIGLDVDMEYNTSEGFIDILIRTIDTDYPLYLCNLYLCNRAEDWRGSESSLAPDREETLRRAFCFRFQEAVSCRDWILKEDAYCLVVRNFGGAMSGVYDIYGLFDCYIGGSFYFYDNSVWKTRELVHIPIR